MQNEIFEQFATFSKNAAKPFIAFGQVFNQVIERGVKQHFDVVNEHLASGTQYVQKLMSSQKIDDVVAVQTQAIKEASNKAVHCAQKHLDNFISTSAELSRCLEENFSSFNFAGLNNFANFYNKNSRQSNDGKAK